MDAETPTMSNLDRNDATKRRSFGRFCADTAIISNATNVTVLLHQTRRKKARVRIGGDLCRLADEDSAADCGLQQGRGWNDNINGRTNWMRAKFDWHLRRPNMSHHPARGRELFTDVLNAP